MTASLIERIEATAAAQERMAVELRQRAAAIAAAVKAGERMLVPHNGGSDREGKAHLSESNAQTDTTPGCATAKTIGSSRAQLERLRGALSRQYAEEERVRTGAPRPRRIRVEVRTASMPILIPKYLRGG